MPARLSIVILNWNTCDLLKQCLTTVFGLADEVAFDVIVVDNASTDHSLKMLTEHFPKVRIIANQENIGYARGNNIGVLACSTEYALILNTDAFLHPGALREMLGAADSDSRAAVVGAQLFNADGTFQASHTPFPTLWREFLILSGLGRLVFGPHFPSAGPNNDKQPRQVDYVEGACLLVRVEAYKAVGGLDESFFMYAEEVDLCYTLRQRGYHILYAPAAQVTHLGGASSADRKPEREGDLYRSRVKFFRKHHGAFSAQMLKAMIYLFTLIKLVTHGLVRLISGGRLGRRVVPLSYLAAQLKGV
jgi:hypothetical protein